MRILIVWPGHSMSTYDVANGYEQALQGLGHTVRNFNFHNWLGFYKEALEYWEKRNPKFHLEDRNAYIAIASDRVAVELVDFAPDVVLMVSGLALHRKAFDYCDRLGIPVVLLLTESPYLDEHQGTVMQKGHIAAALTNDRVSVKALEERSGVKTVYLPHSFDPWTHRPQMCHEDERTDVFFHGTLWPERKALFAGLEQLPHKVRISGVDPAIRSDDPAEVSRVMANQVQNGELARLYSGAKVALNHHRTYVGQSADGEEIHTQAEPWSLGPRAFEIAACGTFQLCDDTRPELAEVFGGSVATYRGRADLENKIEYYLAHDSERREMAAEAAERVKDCSFTRRAESILVPVLAEVI